MQMSHDKTGHLQDMIYKSFDVSVTKIDVIAIPTWTLNDRMLT